MAASTSTKLAKFQELNKKCYRDQAIWFMVCFFIIKTKKNVLIDLLRTGSGEKELIPLKPKRYGFG